MEFSATWIHSLLYSFLIIASVHLLHILIISQKLSINHQNVRVKKLPPLPLRFNSDGTFKILQVADMHFGNGMVTRCRDVLDSEFEYCSDLNTTRFLEKMIELEKPDFVAFTGDNIFGTSATDAAESLFRAFGPVIKAGLPWAAVLGNHDQESTMNREELMSFISLMDYSLSQTFPTAEDLSNPAKHSRVPKIDGFGNYNLRVWGPPGSHLANSTLLNLYFLDSGDRAVVDGRRTYGWIKDSQLSWLRGISKEIQEQKQDIKESAKTSKFSTVSPALTFFHIPIPEIKQGPFKDIVGKYQEYVACSFVNSGVLKTLVSMGDVKAVFIGHDHTNDFCGNLDGIWFCYGGGFGYHGYGVAGWPRRARVILAELGKGEKSWNGVEKIKTWKRLDDGMLSKFDEQILWERQ
ncbi:probable inactive purple acid phosphatase 28 [Olea europaea subsp. europaea]|uniref:Probable inactive purple acid phosphatase 28 n=1 Tax=Olea europaea subsp. europaea TaxID=158383 RepID=A0A8S0PQ27_OLEEU|nr:probable inactive purple acid phosphatase 28 [Olea europaea subsp. europaea]CAA2954835.1 probable inactive purple acid phosphatase 28 [Olea europaea subsp. europaea]